MSARDFLFELGCEELPPLALPELERALAAGIRAGLETAGVPHGEIRSFAAPRRLAVSIEALAENQPEQRLKRRGPPLSAAFDKQGAPTRAATAFAESCGVALDALGRVTEGKGEFLYFEGTKPGAPTVTLLPAIVLLMTSFTRILIVLHFLRSALGTQTTPPSQLLAAIAILLTAVIMNPVLQRTQQEALQPYFDGRITQAEAYTRGIVPFREFMLTHTRDKDLAMFADASGAPAGRSAEQLPIVAIVSAFVTSELRTAFQMGFALFLPFVVVDVIVASVLMSLGMFMLPPAMISLPFKLLLFVLADGWSLVFQNLIASFR